VKTLAPAALVARTSVSIVTRVHLHAHARAWVTRVVGARVVVVTRFGVRTCPRLRVTHIGCAGIAVVTRRRVAALLRLRITNVGGANVAIVTNREKLARSVAQAAHILARIHADALWHALTPPRAVVARDNVTRVVVHTLGFLHTRPVCKARVLKTRVQPQALGHIFATQGARVTNVVCAWIPIFTTRDEDARVVLGTPRNKTRVL